MMNDDILNFAVHIDTEDETRTTDTASQYELCNTTVRGLTDSA